MTRTSAPRPSAAPPVEPVVDDGSPLLARGGLVLLVAALVGAAAAVVAGLLSGPLWLDEAQSVAIARLPLGELPQALREDGAPPLYYLLLHAWMAVAGESAFAVRLPSALLGAVALWLTWVLGRRIGGPVLGRSAVVVLAALPWFSRYASEARMYLLVVVLVLLGVLALLRLRERFSPGAFAGVAACTGALLLTHYWALFLLAAVGLWHLLPLLRRSRQAARVIGAMAVGAVAFLPWLPSFLFQSAHTGAPWAGPASVDALLRSPEMWSADPAFFRIGLALSFVALTAVAVRAGRPARLLAGVTGATLVLAWVSTAVAGGAYVGRYTAVVLPLVVVLLALGVLALPRRAQLPTLAVLAAVGLVTGGLGTAQLRTQGGEVAAALERTAAPGDVVLFCPDQLGPSVARLAPEGLRLIGYPGQDTAGRIDWVDYADRQRDAYPGAVARRVSALAGDGQVFVDFAPGYRTFGHDCQQVVSSLTALRGEPVVEVERRLSVFEEQRLYRFGSR